MWQVPSNQPLNKNQHLFDSIIFYKQRLLIYYKNQYIISRKTIIGVYNER